MLLISNDLSFNITAQVVVKMVVKYQSLNEEAFKFFYT